MPQSLAQVYIHLVFSTKERRAFLQSPELRTDLDAYLGGILRQSKCVPLAVKRVTDHVHLVFRFGRTCDIASLVEALKTGSNAWLKQKEALLADFHWQQGYAAFSVSHSMVETVREYVMAQEGHHQTRSFREELLLLLKKHAVEYDERYLWD